MGTNGIIQCKKIAVYIPQEQVLLALRRFLSIFWKKVE
jgi:hypothetical protein